MAAPPSAHDPRRPGARRATRRRGPDERETLAAAMDALAGAVDAAQRGLRSASPATHALVDEHGFWSANFVWTDGTQVARAAS